MWTRKKKDRHWEHTCRILQNWRKDGKTFKITEPGDNESNTTMRTKIRKKTTLHHMLASKNYGGETMTREFRRKRNESTHFKLW